MQTSAKPSPSSGAPIPADLALLGEEIGLIAAHISAASHRLLALIRSFDAATGWQGWPTCAHWLSWRVGFDLGTAYEKVRVARALGGLPRIDKALREGRISYSKARALTRVATPEREETLLEVARHATGAQLEFLMRKLRQVADADKETPPSYQRYVSSRCLDSGLVKVEAVLRPEEAAVVEKGVQAAMVLAYRPARKEHDTESPKGVVVGQIQATQEQLSSAEVNGAKRFGRADGFVAAFEAFLAMGRRPSQVPGRYEVMVHLDEQALCELEDGVPIGKHTARRLACDSAIVEMRDGEVGRRRRSISAALRRALQWRDKGCRFPGCTNRIFVDGHHVRHWADGGETTLRNVLLLCRFHHRCVHEQGFRVVAKEDGSFQFFNPHGVELSAVAEPPPLSADAMRELIRLHLEEGLELDPELGIPENGGPLDVAWAVEILSHHLGL